jgi:hypothetical protein
MQLEDNETELILQACEKKGGRWRDGSCCIIYSSATGQVNGLVIEFIGSVTYQTRRRRRSREIRLSTDAPGRNTG